MAAVMKHEEEHAIDTEEVMKEIGYFGKYQIVHFLLIMLGSACVNMYNANFIFLAADPHNYRCFIPECDPVGTRNISAPWLPDGYDIKCFRPLVRKFTGDVCAKDMWSGNFVPCTEFVYENDDSLVAHLNLGCSPVKRSMVGTIHYAGAIISMPVMGMISDRYGRKVSYMISTLGGAVIGLTKATVNNYTVYLLIEFLEAAVASAAFTSGFVMLVEISGIHNRYKITSVGGIFGVIGEVAIATLASQIKNYKLLILCIYSPALLTIFYYNLTKESIRWLLVTGRKKRAREIILHAAKWNRSTLSKQMQRKLDIIENIKIAGTDSNSQKVPFKKIITSKVVIIRLLIAMFWWFSSDLIYYGIMVSSVSLPGNKHSNFIYVSLMNIPACILVYLILNRIGRRFTLMLSFLVCGLCIVAKTFVSVDINWLSMLTFLTGKMFIASGYYTVYTYSAELFPTEVRNFLVGISSSFAGVGSIVAPTMPLLASVNVALPFFIFGGLALVSGFLAFFTPETLHQSLPDTIEELNNKSKECPYSKNNVNSSPYSRSLA